MKTVSQVGLNERVPVPREKRFLIHFMRCAVLAALASSFLLLPAKASAGQTNALSFLKSSLDTARMEVGATCVQREREALKQYWKALDALLAALKQKGDLDAYLVVETEKKRFAAEETVPDEKDSVPALADLVTTYRKAVANAETDRDRQTAAFLKKYMMALDGLIKQFMQANKIDDAKTVKAEKDKTAAELADLASKLPPEVKPPDRAEPKDTPKALPQALMKGLVLYYSFDRDEGEKVIDSAGSNNGYITGEVTLTTGTKGLAKTACSFDGCASYITVPGGGTLPDNPTCITQALWVKAPRGTPSGGQYAQTTLLTKRQANDGSDWPTISMDQKHVYFGVDDYAYCKVAQSPKPINDSSWHHVVGVKNGTTYSLYVDGRLAAKPLVDAHPTDGSKANYTIVNRVWSHFSWFAGSIDNVRVYNRALSAGEIAALYDNEKPAR